MRICVCVMSNKLDRPHLQYLLKKLSQNHQIVKLSENRILSKSIKTWPECDVLLSFYHLRLPFAKVHSFCNFYDLFTINDFVMQYALLDRRVVVEVLKALDISVPKGFFINRCAFPNEELLDLLRVRFNIELSLKITDENRIIETDKFIELDGTRLYRPFIEKPADSEDHEIIVYHPTYTRRLFRKKGDRSSCVELNGNIRRIGSFVYSEYIEPDGEVDVKVYALGSDFVHAEARKAPTIDGIVERDCLGKERRSNVRLTEIECEYARRITTGFKQRVCGFDVLRSCGTSYVIDVNGWSFVKTNSAYYDKCAEMIDKAISNHFEKKKRAQIYKNIHLRLAKPTAFHEKNFGENQVAIRKTFVMEEDKEMSVCKMDSQESVLSQSTIYRNTQASFPLPTYLGNNLTVIDSFNANNIETSLSKDANFYNQLKSPLNSLKGSKTFNKPSEIKNKIIKVIRIYRHSDRTPKQKIKATCKQLAEVEKEIVIRENFEAGLTAFLSTVNDKQNQIKHVPSTKKTSNLNDIGGFRINSTINESVSDSTFRAPFPYRTDAKASENLSNLCLGIDTTFGSTNSLTYSGKTCVSIGYSNRMQETSKNIYKDEVMSQKQSDIKLEKNDPIPSSRKVANQNSFLGDKTINACPIQFTNDIHQILEILEDRRQDREMKLQIKLNQNRTEIILKWGGTLTHTGIWQSRELGETMRYFYIDQNPDLFRNVKITASIESRVKKSADMFAEGLFLRKYTNIEINNHILSDTFQANDIIQGSRADLKKAFDEFKNQEDEEIFLKTLENLEFGEFGKNSRDFVGMAEALNQLCVRFNSESCFVRHKQESDQNHLLNNIKADHNFLKQKNIGQNKDRFKEYSDSSIHWKSRCQYDEVLKYQHDIQEGIKTFRFRNTCKRYIQPCAQVRKLHYCIFSRKKREIWSYVSWNIKSLITESKMSIFQFKNTCLSGIPQKRSFKSSKTSNLSFKCLYLTRNSCVEHPSARQYWYDNSRNATFLNKNYSTKEKLKPVTKIILQYLEVFTSYEIKKNFRRKDINQNTFNNCQSEIQDRCALYRSTKVVAYILPLSKFYVQKFLINTSFQTFSDVIFTNEENNAIQLLEIYLVMNYVDQMRILDIDSVFKNDELDIQKQKRGVSTFLDRYKNSSAMLFRKTYGSFYIAGVYRNFQKNVCHHIGQRDRSQIKRQLNSKNTMNVQKNCFDKSAKFLCQKCFTLKQKYFLNQLSRYSPHWNNPLFLIDGCRAKSTLDIQKKEFHIRHVKNEVLGDYNSSLNPASDNLPLSNKFRYEDHYIFSKNLKKSLKIYIIEGFMPNPTKKNYLTIKKNISTKDFSIINIAGFDNKDKLYAHYSYFDRNSRILTVFKDDHNVTSPLIYKRDNFYTKSLLGGKNGYISCILTSKAVSIKKDDSLVENDSRGLNLSTGFRGLEKTNLSNESCSSSSEPSPFQVNSKKSDQMSENGSSSSEHPYSGKYFTNPSKKREHENMQSRYSHIIKKIKKTREMTYSHVSEIYNNLKYDITHNNETIQHIFPNHSTFYRLLNKLNRFIVQNEYGKKIEEKIRIGSAMSQRLFNRLLSDMHDNSTTMNIYFTKESKIYTLFNLFNSFVDTGPIEIEEFDYGSYISIEITEDDMIRLFYNRGADFEKNIFGCMDCRHRIPPRDDELLFIMPKKLFYEKVKGISPI